MPRYLLLLGSNELAEQRFAQALKLLAAQLEICSAAKAWRSPDRNAAHSASTSEIPSYLNVGIEVVTKLGVAELKDVLRSIEARCGRTRPATLSGICPLDIDIVLVWDAQGWRWLDHEAEQQDYARKAFARWLQ